MLRRVSFLTFILISGLATGCTYMSQGLFADREMAAETVAKDHFGDSAKKIVYLESQQWDDGDSLWFYNTTQGSDLIPYDIFLNLKTADNAKELFRSSNNMRKYRYLTQNPSMDNPDGLPVGFVKDDFDGKQYVGFTCAACHTTQVNYKGVGIRIDGGPALADMDGMLLALDNALGATLQNPEKLNALAQAIYGAEQSAADFKGELEKAKAKVAKYNRINVSENNGHPVAYGYARLDAFGRIYNRILDHLKPGASFNSPNAPVSYPFLWDTPQYDFVQWNGIGNNNSGGAAGFFGPLGRNTGEVLGVFATFELENKKLPVRKLSADKRNLVRLESHLEGLKSPAWPENILPKIDRKKAALGKQVFNQYQCLACHTGIEEFTNEQLKHGIVAQFASVDSIGTDKQMAYNAIHAMGETGILKGKKDSLANDADYGDTAPVANLLTTVTTAAIIAPDYTKRFFVRWADNIDIFIRSFFSNPVTKPTVRHIDFSVEPKPLGISLNVYKGRSLNGIWATAPYLHNGSVPNLYELFLPACTDAEISGGKACRSNTFNLGARELDPVRVGFENKNKDDYPNLFTFDTSLPGNGNHGHEYAAGVTPMIKLDANGKPLVNAQGQIETMTFAPMSKAQRYALVEYLKTL
ncbi:MAG: di-heme-cytochrome C peroxidase [Mariprofundaceae bacterium]|nr:di-heme-cytochrome C peroxidase [Mariprofundaceae bacterium]